MAQGNVWAAIAQGASEIGGALLQNTFNKNMQRRQFRHNQQQAEYAYSRDLDMWNRQSDWNLDMWNMQNQYNLPAAQMQRLRDAGLNPNLIYGNAQSGGQATSIQPATSPKYQQVRAQYNWQPFRMPDVLSLYNNVRQANAQVDNTKAATDLTRQKATNEALQSYVITSRAAGQFQDNRMKRALADYSADYARNRLLLERQQLRNQALDEQIKGSMVGRTSAEAGLKQMEYEFFKNLGLKGMRDIAPFLQLLLQGYRGR